jgi:hypothetical protein
MKFLKTLVVIMGVAIVAGLTVVVTTIIQRLANPARQAAGPNMPAPVMPASVEARGSAPNVPFGAVDLPLESGCRIVGTTATDGRVVIQIAGIQSSCDRIHVIDLATGKPLGVIRPQGQQ